MVVFQFPVDFCMFHRSIPKRAAAPAERDRGREELVIGSLSLALLRLQNNQMCTCDMPTPIEEQRTLSSPSAARAVVVFLLPAYLIIVHSVNVARH